MSAAPLPYALLDRRRDRSERAHRVLRRKARLEVALVFLAGVAIAWSIVSTLLLLTFPHLMS